MEVHQVKRALALLFAVALSLVPITAIAAEQPQQFPIDWETLVMRTTTAASATALRPWSAPQNVSGYADSSVFRRGAATTAAGAIPETTMAYRINRWPMSPDFMYRTMTVGVGDTVNTTPWLVLRVRQDSVGVAFTGTTGLDSAAVAAQYSIDGTNWFAVSGTPTRAFLAVTIASGQDGIQPPAVTLPERSPGLDEVHIPLRCFPGLSVDGDYILERSLCMCANYVRFLVLTLDGSGQFAFEVGHW